MRLSLLKTLSRKSINLYGKVKESELMNLVFNEHRQGALQEGLKAQQRTFYCGGRWELIYRSTKCIKNMTIA
jgi:hypothetical protein